MSKIDDERLAKFEGKCWHEQNAKDPSLYFHVFDKCKHCGQVMVFSEGITKANPSYSTSPADRERLWGYLMGKEEMWTAFVYYVEGQKEDDYVETLLPWLSLPLDGVPRWVSLLSEFLGLEGVREKFGWEEVTQTICKQCGGGKDGEMCTNGKVHAEWAKE